ncbi:MAG: hypothetical protein GVY16_04195 [Planctomycetes bacterium]|jgi:hypothetical protein|nr:hypothetical protein [Planctomycetota bacterium]
MLTQTLCHVDREAEHRLIDCVASRAGAGWVGQLHLYAPQLVNLMAEAQDRPMKLFTPQVRRIVLEYEHCDEGGDACSHDEQALEQHVQRLIEALDELRRKRLKEDRWSFVPAAPPMFG